MNRIDYIEIVDPETLLPFKKIRDSSLLAVACYMGKSRLIDNRLVTLGVKNKKRKKSSVLVS